MTATKYILKNGKLPASIKITNNKPFNFKKALQNSEAALLEGSVKGMNGIQWKQCKNDFVFLCEQTEKLAIMKLMLLLSSICSSKKKVPYRKKKVPYRKKTLFDKF